MAETPQGPIPAIDPSGMMEVARRARPPEAGIPTGTGLGKYRILERLRTYHNAIVYKARDSMLDRLVAIKQMSPELIDSPTACGNFKREAQLLARLPKDARHVLHIHELIEDEMGLFIVEEYIEGAWLESLIDKRKVGADAVVKLLRASAIGLRTLHQHHIVHRDIHPGNLMIARNSGAKIANFSSAAHEGDLTYPPVITPKYAAPELLSEQKYDDRVDIYGLGMSLWEVCVGRRALNEYFADIINGPMVVGRWIDWHKNRDKRLPDAHAINPLVSPALGSIISRMTAKALDDRFASMQEVIEACDQNGLVSRPIAATTLLLPMLPSQSRSHFMPPAPRTAAPSAERIAEPGTDRLTQPASAAAAVRQTTTHSIPSSNRPARSEPPPWGPDRAPMYDLPMRSSVLNPLHGSARRSPRKLAASTYQPIRVRVIEGPPPVRKTFRKRHPYAISMAASFFIVMGSAIWGVPWAWDRYVEPRLRNPIEQLVDQASQDYDAGRIEAARQKFYQATTMAVDEPRQLTVQAKATRWLKLLDADRAIKSNDFDLAQSHIDEAASWGLNTGLVSELQQKLWSRKDALRAAEDGMTAISNGDQKSAELKVEQYESTAPMGGLDAGRLRDSLDASRNDKIYDESIRLARQHLAMDEFDKAMASLNDASNIRVTSDVKLLAKQIEDTKKRRGLIAKGDAAFLDRDFARAIESYNEANMLIVSPDVEVKARTAKAHLFLAQANSAIERGDLLDAKDKLRNSLWNSELPDAKRRLEVMEPAFAAAELARSAERAMEREEYASALRMLNEAIPHLPEQSLTRWKPLVDVCRLKIALSEGNIAMKAGDYARAIEFFRDAKRYGARGDIDEKIEKAQVHIKR